MMSDLSQTLRVEGASRKYNSMVMCMNSGVRQTWVQSLSPLLIAMDNLSKRKTGEQLSHLQNSCYKHCNPVNA